MIAIYILSTLIIPFPCQHVSYLAYIIVQYVCALTIETQVSQNIKQSPSVAKVMFVQD